MYNPKKINECFIFHKLISVKNIIPIKFHTARGKSLADFIVSILENTAGNITIHREER